jgi:adenine-specific DNA-methyltransferase
MKDYYLDLEKNDITDIKEPLFDLEEYTHKDISTSKKQNFERINKANNNMTNIKLESRRYIGNKNKLLDWIKENINNNTKNCNSFLDLFAGTASVTKAFSKSYKKIFVNDTLYSNQIIYKAFFEVGIFNEKKLEDILAYYNQIEIQNLEENYFSENFGGKFFDEENAKLIGYIREDIESKKNDLTQKEYCILLATLIYNIDKIANTVGHFDAYIKKTIKSPKLHLKMIDIFDIPNIEIFRENANDLVKKIKADIVYIDPPYNSRQYSRFYHIYENLVKWEKPELFGVALKPKTENMSVYCTVQAKNAFADLIENIDAKYLVVSYNNTYNSKSSSSENKIKLEEITDILNKKGETQIFEASHKYFNTGKTEFNNHKEFLFITKVNQNKETKSNKILRSPLFYVGDKFKLLPQIKDFFPSNIQHFIEPFSGSGSVFLNVKAEKYFLNDIDKSVYQLHNFLLESAENNQVFFENIDNLIDKYGLSKSYQEDIIPLELKQKFVKTYYAQFNKIGFQKLKNDFNKDTNNTILLYLLLIYGFNRMIRFNSKGEYNLPVGNVDFNKNVVDALKNYFYFVKDKNITWYNLDYQVFISQLEITKNDFLYFDPPYLITFSEYNKLWNEEKEQELVDFLDTLNQKGYKFAISNVTHYKGKENNIFIEWAKKYHIHTIKSNYISYHDNSIKNFEEVLVTNYGTI